MRGSVSKYLFLLSVNFLTVTIKKPGGRKTELKNFSLGVGFFVIPNASSLDLTDRIVGSGKVPAPASAPPSSSSRQ